MREADLFILPSRVENLPCVLIESMMSGLPVVATRVGGVPELVSDFAGILVEPENAEALRKAIVQAVKNLGNFPREKIRAYAVNNFSYEAVGRKLLEIYRNVLAKFQTMNY